MLFFELARLIIALITYRGRFRRGGFLLAMQPEETHSKAHTKNLLERRDPMRLENKVAIVTGCGRGLGRAYALRFAREGAKVVAADIILKNAQEVAKEIEADGGQSLALYTDVSDETSTIEMAKKTIERFGGLDILLNNAARYYEIMLTSWDSWTMEEWNKVFAVNIIGMWLCIKAAAPYMMEQRKGKIINIASSVVWEGVPYKLPYNCSKGAVIAMTTALAKELGPHNINVNAIAPGWVPTKAGIGAYTGDKLKAKRELVRNMRCLKRDETPEDLTGTAVFLASEDSDFITGQVMTVDGGATFRF